MTSMLRSFSDKTLIKYQVAFLASEGLTQKKIASLLKLSQSTVSILLHEASVNNTEGAPLLDPRPRFMGSRRIRQSIQNSLFLGELESQLQELGELLDWEIVPSVYIGLSDTESSNWDKQVKAWGRAVAPTLADLLSPCKTICLSWGRQLRSLVEGISSLQMERRTREQALVFACWPPRLSVRPESEDSIFKDHVALGSNSLAFDLSLALNGESSRNTVAQNYLPGIDLIPFSEPPFILDPKYGSAVYRAKLEAEELSVQQFKKAIYQVPAYQRIFGDFEKRRNDCLLRKVDAAIFPSGPAGGPRSFAMGDSYGGIPLEWFKKNTLGDIGGVIIPAKDKKEMSSAVKLQFERLRNHWMGIWEEDIQYIAKHGKVGTIVGAVGSDRTQAILYGCKKQLIRHLFCDPSLAKSLSVEIQKLIEDLKTSE